MDGIIGLIAGFFLGSTFGVFALAITIAARDGDEQFWREEWDLADGKNDKSGND